jgi:hypothetical protein
MSYTITLKDKTELTVTDKEAEEVMKMISQKIEFIILSGQMYSRTTIAKVEKGGSHVKNVFPEAKQLNEPLKYNCVLAGTSIQLSIHRIIKQKHPKDWPKHVNNKEYREKLRLALRAKYPNKKWCDHKENEHSCLSYKHDQPNQFELSKVL